MYDNEGRDAKEGANLDKVLLLLDELSGSSQDKIYGEHIKHMLQVTHSGYHSRERFYFKLLIRLIGSIEEKLEAGSPLRAELKLLKLHLTPPVSPADIELVQSRLDKLSEDLVRESKVDARSLHRIFSPLIGGDTQVANHAPHFAGEGQMASAKASHKGSEAALGGNESAEMNRVRDDFARHVNEAIAQNDEFGVLLDIELNALQEARKLDDLESRRKVLIREVEKFMERHRLLSEKFDKASKYLQLIETDNQQLTDELDRVRLLSLTDELTGLPNRRAFMKRLEDEVGRVNRYGYPISLVLIDLDEFKSINDVYGHAGGDAVLRCYAEYVLSAFRHHDMVCRYGGEEFAVVLPNTTEEGAMRALEKARDYASKAHCMHNGERLDMPTFSAGLAQYKHGEFPSAFIERADAALYRAKRFGRNRIEIAELEGEGSNGIKTNRV